MSQEVPRRSQLEQLVKPEGPKISQPRTDLEPKHEGFTGMLGAASSSWSHSRSTSSRLSDVSSGVFSMEAASDELASPETPTAGANGDSLTRALAELLGLRETDVDEAAAADDGKLRDDFQDAWQPESSAMKRCSSMKASGAANEAAPAKLQQPSSRLRAKKKVVRFADALGLDLTNVRHVADSSTEAALLAPRRCHRRRLIVSPCFPQPGSCAGFLARVMSQKVVLERAGVEPSDGAISGLVRVCNLHYEKLVTLLVTFDGWRSRREVSAIYQALDADGGSGGMTDRFAFQVPLPAGFGSTAGHRAALCVRYVVAGQVHWDSNYGENYAFDCLPLSWADPEEEVRFC